MKGRIFNHPAYRVGLPSLVALCLLAGSGRSPAAMNHDYTKGLDYTRRQIVYADIPAGLCGWLEKQGVRENNFSDYIAGINRSTAERELRGEYDHLIFFLLQSRRFTGRPKIEPALSAYEFVSGLSESERERYLAETPDYLPPEAKKPKGARAQVSDFSSDG